MSPQPPSSAQTHYNRALAAIQQNKLDEAEVYLGEAIAADEQNSEYWWKLGLVWNAQKREIQAIDALKMAISLDPENTEKLEILGDIHYTLGQFKQASFYFMKAHKIGKQDQKFINKMAISLFKCAEIPQAISIMRNLVIDYPDNPHYIGNFVNFCRRYVFQAFDEKTKKALNICLRQSHLKFRHLASVWSSILLLDPAFKKVLDFSTLPTHNLTLNIVSPAFSDPFLLQGLEKIIVTNSLLEVSLSNLRRYFLLHWRDYQSWPKEIPDFLSSLAIQCWYNDFVFFRDEQEVAAIKELTEELGTLFEKNCELPNAISTLVSLAACYVPLYEIYKKNESLPFSKSVLKSLKPLIIAQLTNPMIEQDTIPTIPNFTKIEDDTSKIVQAMYEKRPYPRWKSASIQGTNNGLANNGDGIDVLVAGCGTGQEPAIYANAMKKCHITAIDLSRSSIAYGKRLAKEMGFLPRIDFLHGDLMKVNELNKKFDFIASSGVLHHLKDPEKGLDAILQTLKPDGRISLSLYSKAARDFTLGPASAYIKEKNYSSSEDDIRRFRRDIMTMPSNNECKRCMSVADFYSLSECNDLLFHVQEHRYTPSMIWDIAKRHALVPFHIYMSPEHQQAFNNLFPGQSPLDPDLLEKFEHEFPKTFMEMYKIYFRRPNAQEEHRLDPLIKLGIL